MKTFFYYLTPCLFLLVSCSASKKAYKQAQEYEQAKLYVKAAESDLQALQKDPNFKDALIHLNKVAPKAYSELVSRAESLEVLENWDEAVQQYEHLAALVAGFHEYGVVFPTVNVEQRLERTRKRAASNHYVRAESLFAKKDWRAAALEYLEAHYFVENYNNSFQQAIRAWINDGNVWLSQEEYAQALASFHEILEIAPNHPEATEKIAESHYLWGKQLFQQQHYRQALEQFELSMEYVGGFRDVEAWAQKAYEYSVQFVAVFPFLNESEYSADGYFLAGQTLDRLIHANLRFAEFMTRPETISLITDLRRGNSGYVNEARLLNAANREGLNSIVWGKIRHVSVDERPESFVEFEHEKKVVIEDSTGKEIEETEPVYYREYTKGRYVRVMVEYYIIDSETGEYLDRERFVEDIEDQTRWIAYQGSIYDLPEEKRHLLDAPREPHLTDDLIYQLLESIAEKISREVIQFYE